MKMMKIKMKMNIDMKMKMNIDMKMKMMMKQWIRAKKV